MDKPQGRRRFLRNLTALGAAGSVPAAIASNEAQAQHTGHSHVAQATTVARPAAAPAVGQAYKYFTQPEVDFVEAAVARLIPADDLGPGAKEAGAAYFIDGQLIGPWGTMARQYRLGPWPEGTPQQGYQSPLTPQEVYRVAIREVNLHCRKQYSKTFDALTAEQQDEVLRGLDTGKVELQSVRAQFFFNLLLNNTIEGFFSDPMYGGNRDKVGWKLVGFPGVAAVYTEYIDKHGVPYRAEPVSILDIHHKLAQVDEHGHPVHVLIADKGKE